MGRDQIWVGEDHFAEPWPERPPAEGGKSGKHEAPQ